MGIGDSLKQAGNDLMNSVNNAVSSGDFSHLSSDINWQLKEIQRQVMDSAAQRGQSVYRESHERYEYHNSGTQSYNQSSSYTQENPYKKTNGNRKFTK